RPQGPPPVRRDRRDGPEARRYRDEDAPVRDRRGVHHPPGRDGWDRGPERRVARARLPPHHGRAGDPGAVAGAGRHPDRLNLPRPLDELFAGLAPPVVVACSGGPDSLALLALAAGAGLEPVAVHVDHGARPGSAAEADIVARFASVLGTGFAAETVAVPPGPNFEARARDARYGALERARARLGATAVLVGHTRDDQA